MKQLRVIVLSLFLVWMLASCSFVEKVPTANKRAHRECTSQNTEPTQVSFPSSPTEHVPTDPLVTETIVIAEHDSSDFVRVLDYIPDLVIDLKYAGTDNFTGVIIYDSDEVWLRYGTVQKLMQVQAELNVMGYGLKLWDGFRPPSAQFKLWEICPDPTYVSDPNNGFSNHSRGNTVDITLVDESGKEIEMPTGFDDFSSMADRDYSDCSASAAENARMLEGIMEKYGFKGYRGEWWHYTDLDSYEVEQEFIP